MTDKELTSLSPKLRRSILWGLLAWTVLLIITCINAVITYPTPENKVFPLLVLVVLSVPLAIVAWSAAPWGHMSTTVQYQRIKHLRVVTATQAAIGGVALALIFDFEFDEASMSLMSALLIWTATALFHFVPFYAQISMEAPNHRNPFNTWDDLFKRSTWRDFFKWLASEFDVSRRRS